MRKSVLPLGTHFFLPYPGAQFPYPGAAQRPPSATGGNDDQRRGNSPPREGLPLCVAPYFADLGAATCGERDVHPQKSHPGGGGRLSYTIICNSQPTPFYIKLS